MLHLNNLIYHVTYLYLWILLRKRFLRTLILLSFILWSLLIVAVIPIKSQVILVVHLLLLILLVTLCLLLLFLSLVKVIIFFPVYPTIQHLFTISIRLIYVYLIQLLPFFCKMNISLRSLIQNFLLHFLSIRLNILSQNFFINNSGVETFFICGFFTSKLIKSDSIIKVL